MSDVDMGALTAQYEDFMHLLDTIPVVGRPPREPRFTEQLRKLIAQDPDGARRVLTEQDRAS